MDIKKILIIRLSSIGDIVLTTPVIRCIKNQKPNIEVHFLTKPQYQNLLAPNPYIDELHTYTTVKETAPKLKKIGFDFIIDLHNNPRTLLLKQKLGVKSKSFHKLNIKKWLLVNLKINQMPNIHIVDRYLAAAKPLGITNDGEGLDHFIPQNEELDITKQFPSIENPKYVAFAIGGQHFTKKLPTLKIIEICDNLTQPIILLGGKEDKEVGEIIEKSIKKNQVINSCGTLSLHGSASVVQQADWVITHDTGMMHIAAAFNKKIVSIWGNTVPELGMYPYLKKGGGGQNKMLEVENLFCRPCSKIGFKKCPKGHFKCMESIDINEVKI